jgi:hypothetical protein
MGNRIENPPEGLENNTKMVFSGLLECSAGVSLSDA